MNAPILIWTMRRHALDSWQVWAIWIVCGAALVFCLWQAVQLWRGR